MARAALDAVLEVGLGDHDGGLQRAVPGRDREDPTAARPQRRPPPAGRPRRAPARCGAAAGGGECGAEGLAATVSATRSGTHAERGADVDGEQAEVLVEGEERRHQGREQHGAGDPWVQRLRQAGPEHGEVPEGGVVLGVRVACERGASGAA